MKRRIIKQGHNTLTITLPSQWTRRHNMKAGDEVDLVSREHALIINGQNFSDNKVCEIDITGFTMPLLWRYMQGAYRSGSEEILVYFDPEKKEWQDAFHFYTSLFDYSKLGETNPLKPTIAMIQEIVNRFIGIDIVESGKQFCRIKEMAQVTAREFENSFRRIFITIIHLFDRLIEAMEQNEIDDPSLCKEIHAIDLNIDKLVDYCARILNKVPTIFDEQKKQLIFSSLFTLELAGDEFKYIGKHLATTKKDTKDIVPLMKMAKEHFEIYYKMYYSFNRNLAVEFGEHDVKLYEYHFKMKEGLSGENRSIVKHIMLLTKFTLCLVELRIQMEF